MRVPLGKLTVIDTPLLGNERAKRGLATPRCLSPALRPSQLSARYAWAAEVGVGVGVGVRKIRELAIHCLFSSLSVRTQNTEHRTHLFPIVKVRVRVSEIRELANVGSLSFSVRTHLIPSAPPPQRSLRPLR